MSNEQIIQARQRLMMMDGDITAIVMDKEALLRTCTHALGKLDRLDDPLQTTIEMRTVDTIEKAKECVMSLKDFIDSTSSPSDRVTILVKIGDKKEARKSAVMIGEETGALVFAVNTITFGVLRIAARQSSDVLI